MSRLARAMAVFAASWTTGTAAVFGVLAALRPETLAGPGRIALIGGSAVVAALLVPYGLALLRVAERAAMRITAPSRILGAALLCALPCFGAVIALERRGGVIDPIETVAFAAAGVMVGVTVGAAYPWYRGPFGRRRRRDRPEPREDVEPPAPVGG